MKSTVVIILLLVSFVVASLQYTRKTHSVHDGADQVVNGLRGLKKILSPDIKTALYTVNAPVEVPVWAGYTLAPYYLCVERNKAYDTTLVITTSATDSFLTNKQIIWQTPIANTIII